MRADPLSALRHIEALDDEQLKTLAARVANIQWRRRRIGVVTKMHEYDGGRQIAWRCDPPVDNHEFVVTSYSRRRSGGWWRGHLRKNNFRPGKLGAGLPRWIYTGGCCNAHC